MQGGDIAGSLEKFATEICNLQRTKMREKDRAKLMPAEGKKSLFISPTYQMLGVEKIERRAG
ncbi:MAG: hypothetical protein C4542_08510 [Dehalococcoidia bacterium]|nr:MAG: hypothetical protein C4542_08510 [Dehalococcoidia bacterium]